MLRLALRVSALLAVVCVLPPSLSIARELTFEDRVRAQEAIERVYYSHQIGATIPFEEAVPRDVLERKVRTYLKQSVALERFWHTPVTAQMLHRELERMARGTRMPERLQELYTALDNDPFLIAECLARATLVNRLSRNFFAFDPVIHSDARQRAEMLHRQLVAGELDPFYEHPDRTVSEWLRMTDVDGSSSAGEEPPSHPHGEPGDHQFRLESEEYGKRRGRFPEAVGEIGPLVEEREAFVIRVLLDETAGEARVASFVVKKADWTDWWASVEGRVDERAVRTVATGHDPLPFIGSVTGGLADSRFDNLPGTLGGTGAGTSSCPEDDTWDNGVLDLPDPRYQHTAVWTGTLMIVWGGFDGDSDLDTGGRYDPATDSWTSTSTTGAPSGRSIHTAVWTGSLMVVWGGYPPPSAANTGGRYDPSTDTWAPTSTTGAPSGRRYHTAVWTGSVMVAWGGSADSWLSTGGRYDPSTDSWTPTSRTGAPSGRARHTAVWTGSVMVVWGGYDPSSSNTGGRYDPATDSWTPTSTTGAPSVRSDHTAVWTGSLMVVWGGSDGSRLNTGGRYDPATDSWTPTSTTGAPSSRYDHTAVWTGSVMVVWGGFDGSSLVTGGRYDPVTDSWTPTSTVDTPSDRSIHTAVWTGTLMVVWGGDSGGGSYLNSGGRYDPATDSWAQTSTEGAPSARRNHTAAWMDGLMVVWGGWDGSYLNTGGRYDPATDTWTPTSTTGAPSARSYHTAVWTGSVMVVWGGSDYSWVNTGGRYDPSTDSWSPTSTEAAPSGRWSHTAVWTGNLMIIWGGGTPDGPHLNSGGRYALGFVDDDDGDGFSVCDGDCNDGNDGIYPGAPEICDDIDNQCPGDVGHAQVDEGCDDDGDGNCDGEMIVVGTPSVCPGGGGDCNDHDSNTYPGASETNDGSNNQCPGDDGYGVVDEISGESGFHNPADRTEFSWPDQAGATSYEVARSSAPDFSANCIQVTTTDAYWNELETPDEGAGFFYLVRPLTPFVGSWGEDSTGVERTHICPVNPNVVLNGDMESWTSSTNLSVWQETRTAGTIDQETDPGYVYEGDSAARLTRTSSGVFNIMQAGIPLEPGEDYRLKVAAMFNETRAGALQVRILNATRGEDLRTDGAWSTGWHYFDFDLTPSYQRHQIDFTVDAGYDATDDFRLIIRHNNVTPTPIGSELWIDDVEIRAQ